VLFVGVERHFVVDASGRTTAPQRATSAMLSGVDLLWRYSTHDAFYQPPGVPLVPGSANGKRFLGEQFCLHAEWQATPHINVNVAYVHFLTDGFQKAANAKDIDFLGVWTSYKF
jgi:hypothetical protein